MITYTIGKDGRRYYFENGKRVSKPSKSTPKKTLKSIPKSSPKKSSPKKSIPKKSSKSIPKSSPRRSPSTLGAEDLISRQLFPRPVPPPPYSTTLTTGALGQQESVKKYLSQFPKSELYLRKYGKLIDDTVFIRHKPNQIQSEKIMGDLIQKRLFPLAVVYAQLLLRYFRIDQLKPSLQHLVKRWKDRSNFCVIPLEEMEIDNKLYNKLKAREFKNKAKWEKEEDEREDAGSWDSPYSPFSFHEVYPQVTGYDYEDLLKEINGWLRLGELPPQAFIEEFVRDHVWLESPREEDKLFLTKMKEIIRQLYPSGSLNSYLQKFMAK